MSFKISPITEELKKSMAGKSYPLDPSTALITYDELRYVTVDHYDFDGHIVEGEFICNASIADKLLSIFKELLVGRYPIEKMKLIDIYDADDERSMADNNSSAFNYRVIAGTNRLSNHAKGLAIDINPLYNPYIPNNPNTTPVQPANATPYVDRDKDFPYKIMEGDLCLEVMKKYGFGWGGDWVDAKDYQHFEWGGRAK